MCPPASHLTVGDVARSSGVSVQTMHYYERRGLLPKPLRNVSNYRVYPSDTPSRIRFIQRAQQLGFSLEEIKELLSLRARPQARCVDVLKKTQSKIRAIDEKVEALQAMRRALSKLAAQCEGRREVTACPILESLHDGEGW